MSVFNKIMIFLGLKRNSNNIINEETTTVQCEEFNKIDEQIPEINITNSVSNLKENKELEKVNKTDIIKTKKQHKSKSADTNKQDSNEKPITPKKKRTYKKKQENTKKEV